MYWLVGWLDGCDGRVTFNPSAQEDVMWGGREGEKTDIEILFGIVRLVFAENCRKCNIPMNPHVRLLACRSYSRSWIIS